jgi:hypothetical protein
LDLYFFLERDDAFDLLLSKLKELWWAVRAYRDDRK